MQRKRPLAVRNTIENRLWAQLRALDGYRFRRKAPFKSFTLDFVEHQHRLVISLATVKKHVSNLLGKFQAETRTQAIARAREWSVLE